MIEPYQAVELMPTIRGIRWRDEIRWNLDHIAHLIKAASWLSSLDLPVRLIAIRAEQLSVRTQTAPAARQRPWA